LKLRKEGDLLPSVKRSKSREQSVLAGKKGEKRSGVTGESGV